MAQKFDKEQVAKRQLDTAIELFFRGGDPVSIHTLSAAATTVLADIIQARGGKSWRERLLDDALVKGMSKKDFYNALRSAQNFFKHGDKDADGEIEFDETVNDTVMFVGTVECGILAKENKVKLSDQMSVFQLWIIATSPHLLPKREQVVKVANTLFPAIDKLPRFEQIARGGGLLKQYLDGEKPHRALINSIRD